MTACEQRSDEPEGTPDQRGDKLVVDSPRASECGIGVDNCMPYVEENQHKYDQTVHPEVAEISVSTARFQKACSTYYVIEISA